jgi:hypothetical protein
MGNQMGSDEAIGGCAADKKARGEQPKGWRDKSLPWGDRDRAGRLVVDDDERKDGEVRLAGPALTVVGAVLLLMGWYVGADAVVVVAGVALTVFGLLLPR